MAGHNVYTADSTRFNLCSCSNAVKKSFFIPSPRFEFDRFVNRLNSIISDYNIDMIVPIFEETMHLAKARPLINSNCEIFCPPLDIINQLHNKWSFHKLQQNLNIEYLPSKLIGHIDDLKDLDLSNSYALKPCYSRGSFSMIKISKNSTFPNLKIDSNKPWIAQMWVDGKKYCTYSICRNGNIQAHCVYPNKARGEGYCMSFEAVKHDKIYNWIEKLVKSLNYTGQISFDFVETEDGKLYALECNPRTTSGLHLLDLNPNLSECFFQESFWIHKPETGLGRQLGFGMLLYGLNQREEKQSLSAFVKKHLKFKDVVYSEKDLKPFLLQLFIFVGSVYDSFKYKLPIPEAFTHDLNFEEELKD